MLCFGEGESAHNCALNSDIVVFFNTVLAVYVAERIFVVRFAAFNLFFAVNLYFVDESEGAVKLNADADVSCVNGLLKSYFSPFYVGARGGRIGLLSGFGIGYAVFGGFDADILRRFDTRGVTEEGVNLDLVDSVELFEIKGNGAEAVRSVNVGICGVVIEAEPGACIALAVIELIGCNTVGELSAVGILSFADTRDLVFHTACNIAALDAVCADLIAPEEACVVEGCADISCFGLGFGLERVSRLCPFAVCIKLGNVCLADQGVAFAVIGNREFNVDVFGGIERVGNAPTGIAEELGSECLDIVFALKVDIDVDLLTLDTADRGA